MYYNGNQWINDTANVNGNVVTIAAQVDLSMQLANTGTVDFNVVFNSIEHSILTQLITNLDSRIILLSILRL